jgi:hypothetical protein
MIMLLLIPVTSFKFENSQGKQLEFATIPRAQTQTGGLKITTRDANGFVISSTYITSTVAPSGQTELSGITDINGVIVFSNLLPGGYTIQASRSSYTSVSTEVKIEAGVTSDVTITLRAQSSATTGGISGYPYIAVLTGVVLAICVWILSLRSRPSLRT